MFPKDAEIKKKWMVAIRRDRWQPTKTSLVCRSHFAETDIVTISWHGENYICRLYLEVS